MIAELFAHYRVRSLSAVCKRGNLRSVRLLERPGFAPGSAEQQRGQGIEPGEALMVRDLRNSEEHLP